MKTPPLVGTILPGITRATVLELARRLGYTVEEAPISVTEALQADEVFTTGAPLSTRCQLLLPCLTGCAFTSPAGMPSHAVPVARMHWRR